MTKRSPDRFEIDVIDPEPTPAEPGRTRARSLIRYAKNAADARREVYRPDRRILAIRKLGPVESEQSEFIYGASYRGATT